jgi:hypothetical protein
MRPLVQDLIPPSAESDEELPRLKAELRSSLLPVIKIEVIVGEILGFLKGKGDKRYTREELALAIANCLAAKWSFVRSRRSPIERLIENRPRELDTVVQGSRYDDFWKLAKAIANLPRKKRRRAKPRTDKERRKNIQLAKNRHERVRWHRGIECGLIEREFSKPPAPRSFFETITGQSLAGQLPGGPCLDDLLRGSEVRMSKDMYSLESLFGRSRKLLPTALRRHRVGRNFFYGHHAVLQCIDALLEEKNRRTPWLPDPAIRQFVLAGILIRAQATAAPEILADFEQTLQKHTP